MPAAKEKEATKVSPVQGKEAVEENSNQKNRYKKEERGNNGGKKDIRLVVVPQDPRQGEDNRRITAQS